MTLFQIPLIFYSQLTKSVREGGLRIARTGFQPRFIFLLLTLLVCQGGARAGQQAQLFIDRTLTRQEIVQRDSHAIFEPPVGCYLGGFIDFDPSLKRTLYDLDAKKHKDPAEFEKAVGRQHAMYFFYVGYRHPMPWSWLKWLGKHGKFAHIALEPNEGLNKVQDDGYLRSLAEKFAKSGAKIFLRFGSEMNGTWTVYHDPTEFKRKFRLVYNVMHRYAPNVALVWCPYSFPIRNIPDYYPGDDATDWVGVNMYSVTYHDNKLTAPADSEHPCDLLSFVYDRYSAKKPFMICEFAATHNAACEKKPRVEFANRKILTLYSALPRLYPRVKAINYFDSNNILYTKTANNDYSVTNEQSILAAYKFSIQSSYFLSAPPASGAEAMSLPMPIRQNEVLKGKVNISCFARAPSDILTLRYKLDGKLIREAALPDSWPFAWDTGKVSTGRHALSLEVHNAQGKLTASQTVSIVVTR